MLRELETRLRLDSPRATASMPQGQGKPVQNTSPISKRGRPLEPPSAWWGNQIGALWPYSKKQASGLRKKRAKALKSPDEQSSSAAVPNAQRCTRNDGKYWQCGNERASGRKLCEYHWQYEMKRRKRRAEAMGAVSKKKAGVEVTGAGGASKKRRADVGAYLAVDGTSSAKEPLGVRSQGGAEWIRKEFIGAVKARRARGDDVSRGPKGTRVRASTRRWWEANGSEATGEPKEKRSPGLPFLEENALEGEAVEAVGAGEQ